MSRWSRLSVCLLLLWLSGCASVRSYQDDPLLQGLDRCAALLGAMQQRVAAAGVADPFAQPLRRYPYLRSSRMLASSGQQLQGEDAFQFWRQQLWRLGQQARGYSLDNLPPALRFSALERHQIEACLEQLAARDAALPDYRQRLRTDAVVKDSYNDALRLLGLFPLTRQVVLQQVRQWQRQWGGQFNSSVLLQGESRLYRPRATPPAAGAGAPFISAPREQLASAQQRHPLGWPVLPESLLQRLFDYHAPEWQLFVRSAADQIGAPRWQQGQLLIDGSDPVSYRLASYTRFRGQILLQLNYQIWLPERAAQGWFDIYAGPVDGLIWRVTLNPDGSVLLYDSIHACGCYHLLFPRDPRLQPKTLPSQTEAPLVLTRVAPPRSAGRLRLQLTPDNHYLQGIGSARNVGLQAASRSVLDYRAADYQQLRSLPMEQGRRGLFDPDGLIGSSRRPERWLLWPMGVPSAGAQRIWGQHAVSFASKRHFDDPELLESLFEWREHASETAP